VIPSKRAAKKSERFTLSDIDPHLEGRFMLRKNGRRRKNL
jgi:hypothetical protein